MLYSLRLEISQQVRLLIRFFYCNNYLYLFSLQFILYDRFSKRNDDILNTSRYSCYNKRNIAYEIILLRTINLLSKKIEELFLVKRHQ